MRNAKSPAGLRSACLIMDEPNNFVLVRKPSSAVEKAAPGAKRILSGMVADALALARPVFTVFIFVEAFGSVAAIIKSVWAPKYQVRFIGFRSEDELLRLVQEQPFDLIFLHKYNFQLESLERIEKQYGKPIFARTGGYMMRFERGVGSYEKFSDLRERIEEHHRQSLDSHALANKTRPFTVVICGFNGGLDEQVGNCLKENLPHAVEL